MQTKSFKTRLFQAAAVSPLILASQVQAQPHVTVVHPAGTKIGFTGETTKTDTPRTVDCSKIKTIGGKRYLTPEFAQQVDVNDQKLYVSPPPNTTDVTALQHYWGGVTGAAFGHAAQFHGQCLAQFGRDLRNKGQPLPAWLQQIPNWEQKSDCPTLVAYSMCMKHPDMK